MEAKRSSKHEDDGVSLPEDIIFDVLVGLPVKALCRFRCESKAWRALISDPAFVASQRSHAGRLIVAAFGSWPDYELRLLDMQGNVLRVFEAWGSHDHRSTRMDLIFVKRRWQGAMIIDPAARRSFTVGRHAHDEEIRWSNYSFGRAAPSGAYKVLHLSKTHTTVCEVATITGDGAEPTWRQRPTPDLFNGFSPQHKVTTFMKEFPVGTV
ncbi:putative F-box protein At4g09190 [Miscanthus floridulus]|uniref:putative F-box protein At4g09190 n=1 Tax=Miscanthus floridulus TaxID=154761 RepID=UPI00345908D1